MTSENLPERVEAQPLATQAQNPMSILARAVQEGADPAAIEKLAELAWKQEDRNAAQEFTRSLAAFQRECPSIIKDKIGGGATRGGSSLAWKYASFDQILDTVRPHLLKHGFSLSFDSTTDGKMVKVVCTLRHEYGHSQASSFECPADSKSPSMSEQQKYGGAMTFASRYAMRAALGLTEREVPEPPTSRDPVTQEQAATLRDLISATNSDPVKFLDWIGAPAFEEILASDYDRAVRALKAKGKK